MTCEDGGVLLHALMDSELDASHAHQVEAHLATCPRCTAQLRQYRDVQRAIASLALRYQLPVALRRRIEAAFSVPPPGGPNRRTLLRGFAMGTVLSAAAAVGVMLIAFRAEDEQRIVGEIISAHLRSLQVEHLTDVQSGNQQTIKPWFNGRFDAAPPVLDLTAQGFTLIGGRLDYVDGKPVAAIVYKRRAHIINLFVAHALGPVTFVPRAKSSHGLHVVCWTEQSADLLAVSDIDPHELQEFAEKFQVELRAGSL
jgi:anti-sigma factor RsiW